jgi:3-deoxy-D-manno-octulosonic-acid transferase
LTFPIRWAALYIRYKDDVFTLHEKMGRPTEDRPRGDLVWVHAKDIAGAAEVVRGINAGMPGKIVLVTYNARGVRDRPFVPGAIRQFAPIDNVSVIRNFLKFWEPSIAIYTGAEISPIQLHMLRKANIPSFMVNGNIPDKSYRWWKRVRWAVRKIVRCFKFVWAVDNKQVLRFANLGAQDVKSQELLFDSWKMREIILKIKREA